ncbi:hypothetical protein J1N35_016649 [Gossypium stocksii]|uniref:KIB1-4 beta-propeller domain-containing protein n=1 Tax=Gossypium stocksii TaxID=47602 RepID=A0A9D4A3B1_9ROSI|nr:hypothetical protein J1N35_016649 [Gossypium stocksii]
MNYLLSQMHPMLIVPLNAQDVWNLYSIKDNKLLPLPFQVPYVDRSVDSSNGWVRLTWKLGYNYTKGAKVWNLKLDLEGWEWREMKTMGDCTLFVGDNISLSVVASDFCTCQPNYIYFINDYENFLYPSMILENSNALKYAKDMGVYNMETRSFTPYDTAKDDMWLVDTTKLRIVPSFVVYEPA